MVDIEDDVIALVDAALTAQFSPIIVSGDYMRGSATFPHVLVQEQNNAVYESSSDSGDIENHAEITFRIEISSNRVTGKKAECKAISYAVDDVMNGIGFRRFQRQPMPNVDGNTVYRMILMYRGIVGKDGTVYRS